MKNIQIIIGFSLLLLIISLAYFNLSKITLFYRFLIGIGFGFALSKASMGFAGSVNRLSRMGTASLAKALLLMFILTSILTSFLIYDNEISYSLNIYPINLGLILGGLLFGFGMALSSCCATGSLTDLASGFSRASVTIFFFAIGVFLGFRFQGTASWIRESWISTSTGEISKGGVFLPDLFLFDGFNGYLGAIILTAVFSYIIIYIATKYETKPTSTPKKEEPTRLLSYDKIFMQAWSMKVSIVIVAVLFVALLEVSGKGWSATSPFGVWFAKILMMFGTEASWISEFTTRPTEFFTQSLLAYGTSLQNFGIIFGTIIALLLSKTFSKKFIAGLKISKQAFLIYAVGGFIMGFGTRLSNGCNVGALFTPIAEFSLSGWIYLVVVVIGGFTGNWFIKRYISSTCSF